MTVIAFKHIRVFRISEVGGFILFNDFPGGGEIDTADFAADDWGYFRRSDGMVTKLDGPMSFEEDINDQPSHFDSTSLRLWYDMHGSPVSHAGTYVVLALAYSSAHQPGIELAVDTSVAGDGYIAMTAEYDTLDADRTMFFSFGGFAPTPTPVDPPTPFWTGFIGSHENL